MNTRLRWQWLRAALLCLPLGVSSAQTSPAPEAYDLGNGQELYLSYGCYACHLYSGSSPGAPLVPMRMPLAAFIAYLRNPPRPNLMPPYGAGELGERDAADVWAYIRTLPESPAPGEIPLLEEILQEIRSE